MPPVTSSLVSGIGRPPAPVKVLDVIAAGAEGDGIEDDTGRVQAAQAAVGDRGVLWFAPDRTFLLSDTITVGDGCCWEGARGERGCNAAGSNPAYPSTVIKFRPVDTAKYLVSRFETTNPGVALGPFIFRNLTFDLGGANGFKFGDEATALASQRAPFSVRFENCAFTATLANLASDVNGTITRSGRVMVVATKCFEMVFEDCSFFGGDAHVRTFGCDKPVFIRCRSQYAWLPFDLQGSDSFSVQHTLEDVQVEVYGFTPFRMKDVMVSGTNLRWEQIVSGAPAGFGRFVLPATAQVTAGSGTLTFSQDMTNKLFPFLSLIELTDGTNTDTCLVTAVAGTSVTVDTTTFTFDWTHAAATVTRIHGYGPIKIGDYDAQLTNTSGHAAVDCPYVVLAQPKNSFSIVNGHDPAGAAGSQTSLVVGNHPFGSTFMNGVLTFTGCSPHIIADPNHPFVRVLDWRPDHGRGTYDANFRSFANALADEWSLLQRRWVWSPKGGATAFNNNHLILFKPVVGEPNTLQRIWAWKVLATDVLRCYDTTLPGGATSIRLRVRLRGVSGSGNVAVAAVRDAAGTALVTIPFTTTWSTYSTVVTVPLNWQAALADRDLTVGLTLDPDADCYIAAVGIEDVIADV